MSAQGRRLPTGGRIDRDEAIGFSFDGRRLEGLRGDTLASALLANGVTLAGRSFKYHRPRGVFSAGPEEPNALVTLGTGDRREPNLPATTLRLAPGMRVESQNRFPSLSFDLQNVNEFFAPLLSSGFYYKTFMGPTRRAWMIYERFIRRAAGLGRASFEPDEGRYEVRQAFCDVAIVGGGPAGLSAARTAALGGARVTLVEQDFLLGGQLLAEPAVGPAAAWLAETEAALRALGNVTVLTSTTAFGAYDGNVLGLVERHDDRAGAGALRQTMTLLRAGTIVFAAGAVERPLTFANNDRPGIMLATGARIYLNRFAVLPGRNIVVATTNDRAYATAFDLAAAGADVTVADLRAAPPADLLARAKQSGIAVHPAARIDRATGRRAVTGLRLQTASRTVEMACDCICVSGGWTPTVHLASQRGFKPVYREEIDAFVPGGLPAGCVGAGAMMGSQTASEAIAHGHRAVTEGTAYGAAAGSPPAPLDLGETPTAPAREPAFAGTGKAFVDFQMDVTTKDIALAHREGYVSVEHLKRYTTLGMGTDQGKTSNFAALSTMAALRGVSIAETGTTTFRPPYTPVTIGALAGRRVGHHYKPIRRTPMHDWHLVNGAEMLEVGLWLRPWFYREAGPDVDAAYVAEMRNVRNAAGLMDVSTLGKIDIQGPDAATFLGRLYANGFAKLPVGRARYGVMLRDDGIVLDDGTTARLGENYFFMTTSTAKAADVLSWMEFLLDTVWPGLRVSVSSVTDEWAAMSIAGPKSRTVLTKALPGVDLSDAALPHTGLVESSWKGRSLRILRLSYSGERAYELYVGARSAEALWTHLLEAGRDEGLLPYGVEALGALRVEKGHIAGPEIDGRTTIDDLGLGRMTGKRSGFVGDVLRRREAFGDPARPRLVGLKCAEPGKRLRSGALLFSPGAPLKGHGLGRVTSVTYSPSLDGYVGLALLARHAAQEGTELVATHPIRGETVRARVVSPVFLDPEGERLHG